MVCISCYHFRLQLRQTMIFLSRFL